MGAPFVGAPGQLPTLPAPKSGPADKSSWTTIYHQPPISFVFTGVKRNSPLAKFSTIGLSAHASSKFMTLTLSLTLIYDPNPNPNPIPCEILDACADSQIVENFASGEFRATPGVPVTSWCCWNFLRVILYAIFPTNFIYITFCPYPFVIFRRRLDFYSRYSALC